MKKKTIILSTILAISCTASIGVLAAAEDNSLNLVKETVELNATLPDASEIDASSDKVSFIDKNAAKTIAYSIDDASVALTYEKTNVDDSGIQKKVYSDSKGNSYYFSQSGQLLECKMSNDNLVEANRDYVGDKAQSGTLTEKEAIAYAEKAAKERFGSKFDLVEFDEINQDSMDSSYYVYYWQRLGEDGFIKGICYYANVLQDGSLYACSMGNYDDLINFDESLLDGVTEATIRASVEKELAAKYGDIIDYEIVEPRLFNKDGHYYIGLSAHATVMDKELGREISVGDRIYYDLPVE